MPLEKLLERIEEDARKEAKKIKKTAEIEAAEIIKKEETLNKEDKDEELLIAKTQAKARQEAIIASARLEAKNVQLEAKREILDKAFALALDELNSLDGAAYQETLSKLKAKYSTGKGNVVEAAEKGLMLIEEEGAQIDLTFRNLVDYHKALLEQEVFSILVGASDE